MTLEERIKRCRWYLDAIEAKAGSSERGRLDVALVDALRHAEDAVQIVAIVAARREAAR